MVVSAPVSMSIARTLDEATSLRKRLPRVHVCSATAKLVMVKRASQRMVDVCWTVFASRSLLASDFNHKPDESLYDSTTEIAGYALSG
eukprot:2005412-Rhodomonas_salina.1